MQCVSKRDDKPDHRTKPLLGNTQVGSQDNDGSTRSASLKGRGGGGGGGDGADNHPGEAAKTDQVPGGGQGNRYSLPELGALLDRDEALTAAVARLEVRVTALEQAQAGTLP